MWAASLLTAGAVGVGAIALSLPASAENVSNPPTATADPSGRPDGSRGGRGHGPRGGQRPGETLLTGADAEKVRAAALRAVPGATVVRVETDADGAAYEAHVTTPDGTRARVKFDKDFNVTGVETDEGHGGPGAPGGSGGPGPTQSPASHRQD